MNNAARQRCYMVLLSLFSITVMQNFVTAQERADKLTETQELHGLAQETLEKCFQQALTHVRLVDSILEGLAFNIANSNGPIIRSRSKTIENIRKIREILSALKESNYVVLNSQLVYSYIYITNAIVHYITDGIKKGLDNWKEFDINTIHIPLKRSPSYPEIEYNLTANDQLIQKLDALTASIGLHWYNKAYRNFKRLVINPVQAAALPAVIAGTAAGSAFFLWYYSDMENPKWLRDKVGWPAVIATDQIMNSLNAENDPFVKQNRAAIVEELYKKLISDPKIDDDAKQDMIKELQKLNPYNIRPVGFLGRLEARIAGLMSGRFALGSAVMAGGALVGRALLPIVGSWIGKKAKSIDNFLMGGAYKNRNSDEYIYSIDVTFDNLIGQENAKQYGRELCQYLKNPELFDRAKIAPSTGILLFGDTRTGKSFYISALFGEIQKALGSHAYFKMWKVSFQELLSRGIQTIMDEARREAPMILVIEEVDLLGLQRVNNAERLAAFMTAMSSCLQENTLDKTVIVIGTTNKLENLEPALREPGRFGKHIFFSYPKLNERKQFIERELIKTACDLTKFDIDGLAQETEGCSYEKLALFIKRAFLKAKLYGDAVKQETLEESIDENIRGISRETVTLSPEQKELVATHLAGHVVASILLDPHQKISKVTLRDVASKIEEELAVVQLLHKGEKTEKQAPIEHGKIFAHHDHDMPDIETSQERIKQCKITLAGHVAEIITLGSCSYGYHPQDKQKALNIAKSMTCATVDLVDLPDEIKKQYYDQAFALVKKCEQEVKDLLESHRTELDAVRIALMEKLTLDSHDIARLVLGQESVSEELDSTSLLKTLLKDQVVDEQKDCTSRQQSLPNAASKAKKSVA